MKTLHRIRHNINITFANFQACVIFGFLDMGIFMWIADQFMWFWATSGELDDPSLSAAQIGNPTIELQDFLRLAYPYHTLSQYLCSGRGEAGIIHMHPYTYTFIAEPGRRNQAQSRGAI